MLKSIQITTQAKDQYWEIHLVLLKLVDSV